MATWAQKTAGFRRGLSENFGFRGSKNLTAWGVAGILTYYIWIKPERKAAEEQQAARQRAKEHAQAKGLVEVDRVRPTADPQVNGLMRGHRQGKDP
ncbi:hypothetical protein WJX73_008241 [Symbiochloris irregularis]|uniref:ATP synthase subunit e, mitochondrial n=1 Tax=Symbiochloris irregularis TaxID=706552 RepID=A0AAW1NVP8_9CHLO